MNYQEHHDMEKDMFNEDMELVNKRHTKQKRKWALIILALVILGSLVYELLGGFGSSENEINCTVEVRCDTVTGNPDALVNQDNLSIIPADGVGVAEMKIIANEGDTVFDVTSKMAQVSGIDFVESNKYITQIGKLAVGDCGAYSGWLFTVNGEFVMDGAEKIEVQDGDKIVWLYTIDGGSDIGAW